MSIALSSAGPGYGYPLVPVDCSPGLLVDPCYPVVILDPGEKKTLPTIIMTWAVYIIIFMYSTSQDLNPLSRGDFAGPLSRNFVSMRVCFYYWRSHESASLGIRISTHTNCSLLPRISKTSHAGPMSTSYSPRSAVTAMVVGTSLLDRPPVILNIHTDDVVEWLSLRPMTTLSVPFRLLTIPTSRAHM